MRAQKAFRFTLGSKHVLISFIIGGLIAAVFMLSSVWAQSWTQTSAPNRPWHALASSADGSHLAAAAQPGLIYISTDSGTNWAPTSAPNTNWVSLAASADGARLIAAAQSPSSPYAGPIWISADSGANWNLTAAPVTNWVGVASSADGSRLAAVTGHGGVYLSADAGSTWVPAVNTNRANSSSIASSADGAVLLLGADPPSFSTDGGTTWIRPSGGLAIFARTACSADGRVLAGAYDDSLWISANWGANWTSSQPYGGVYEDITSVACSADGTRLVVAGAYGFSGGPIATSTNSGATWTIAAAPTNRSWRAVASSADGFKLVAADSVAIYTYQARPTPRLNLSRAGADLALSWQVPSANFLLQHSPDLSPASWTTLTNSPVLNLTNLEERVILSPQGDRGFYRLFSQ